MRQSSLDECASGAAASGQRWHVGAPNVHGAGRCDPIGQDRLTLRQASHEAMVGWAMFNLHADPPLPSLARRGRTDQEGTWPPNKRMQLADASV